MKNSTASVKLTSKNQLTMPASVVRKLKLQPGNYLNYRISNGRLILSPRPSINEQLEKIWAENAKYIKGAASDESIKETMADYYRKQAKRP